MMNRNDYFRQIPKVDTVLENTQVQELCQKYGRGLVVDCIRNELDALRLLVSTGDEEEVQHALHGFLHTIAGKIHRNCAYPLRKVWNGTGIILHTNLGRAPLGQVQMEAVMQAMSGYSNLEYSLAAGNRGKRWEHYASTISTVTGSEGAVAVNNNAAAVTLMLSALTKGKEVIVSRGELIEIGGRFRIPEVMEQSGARLREVGTTNRTRISDYENAITEETGALLKVHTSNYKILGFTEEASVEELVALGKKYNLPVIVDLGSGVLVNLEKYGLDHEPTVQETIKKGADLVSFSGDKLLGGPQAGIIAGKRKYINAMENHPLMRAIRLDKCTIAALAATFREYLDEKRAEQTIPVLRMISRTQEELKMQAEGLAAGLGEVQGTLKLAAEPSISMMGGGSLPMEEISSYAVTITPLTKTCEEITAAMRDLPIPIIAHVKSNKIWLDMRTIMPEDVQELQKELKEFLLADVCGNRTHPC